MVAGAATQKLMNKLATEQEIIMNIADMAICTYVSEGMLMRVMKNKGKVDEAKQKVTEAMTRVYIYDSADRAAKFGKDAVNAFADGDELKMMLLGLKRFTKTDPFNTKDARRAIADYLIEKNRYTI